MNAVENWKIKQNLDTAARIIEGQALVITPEDSFLHTMNEVGTRIWEIAEKEIVIKDIIETICQEFEVNRDEACRDVIEFIQQMLDKNLIIKL